jgi:hypothetical protein
MGARYDRWGKGSRQPVFDSGPTEQKVWQHQLDLEASYLLTLNETIQFATEHIAQQLIVIYNRIANATAPEQIYDLTTHERFVVRTAAINKIELLQGRTTTKVEKVTIGYARWPGDHWSFPRSPN